MDGGLEVFLVIRIKNERVRKLVTDTIPGFTPTYEDIHIEEIHELKARVPLGVSEGEMDYPSIGSILDLFHAAQEVLLAKYQEWLAASVKS